MAETQAQADDTTQAVSEEEAENHNINPTLDDTPAVEPNNDAPEISDVEDWEAQVAAMQDLSPEQLEALDEVANNEPTEPTAEEEAQPETSEATPVESTENADTPTEEEEPATTQQQQQEEEKLRQFRLRPNSKAEERAFELRKSDPLLSLRDAISMAEEELGITASPTEATTENSDSETADTATESTTEDTAETPEALEKLIAEKRAEKYQAIEDFDNPKVAELEAELDKLIDQHRIAERTAAEQQESTLAAQNEIFDQAEAEVITNYPDAANPESQFAQRMAQVDEAWREMGDSRANDPEKPRIIAGLVAKEFGIHPATDSPESTTTTPVTKPAPAPPVPQSQVTTAPRKTQAAPIQPASGSHRTSQPPTLATKINSVQDEEDYEALLLEMTG